jgi:hypothetical protein
MFSSQQWVEDTDPLITDQGVCKYDGGLPAWDGCHFYYLYNHVVNFKPSGALSSKASCKLPSKFAVDPKGAAQASYAFSGQSFSTGGTPITCVVQVWVSP